MEQLIKKSKSEILRQKAEDALTINHSNTNVAYSEADELKLIHELQVHQIELELQNEELIQATERAETASDKYSELYDFAPIGYYTLTKDGYINELNFIGASMLRKERAQLINRMFADFVSNDTKPVFIIFLEKIFSSLKLESCEVILTTDGSLPMNVSLTGIVTINRDHCMVTATDITKQKQADTELRQKNLELKKLNIQKDKFLSIIAHDLRGPFNGFLGLTEIIATEISALETAEIQKMGETMWQSAQNIFKLLENLLQWSQMEQGLIPYKPTVFRLVSFAEDSLISEFQTAKNKEIAFVFDIPYDIFVLADHKMLRSILSNLCSNATKFTPNGGKITISARYSGNDRVEILVTDTGIGISKEIQKKLFLLNEQINRKGTDGELSTGLGLFLCKEFIEKHNGTIRVRSAEGKGSTFSFTVPCIL
jgi:signal transduction histidine kinase